MLAQKGIIQTILGNGEEGWDGDGGPALDAACQLPYACEFDSGGNMIVCMGRQHRIRRMDAQTGIITLVAGTSEGGYSGDGGPALDAVTNQPYGLAVDANGDMYFSQRFDPAVRKIDGRTGVISTVAGTGEFGYSGDGGPGNEAMLREPNDLYLDGQGGLLIADIQDQRIRRVDLATGIITTFAGTGEKSRAGDGKPAAEASLMGPRAVCMDSLGNTYFAEREGNGVRKVSTGGILTTIAGADSVFGYTGDGGPAVAATWGAPKAMRCDLNDNVIVVDTENCAVRRIDGRTGVISTVAGTGEFGYSGDGGPGNEAMLREPNDLYLDGQGGLLIADIQDQRIRRVDLATGIITTFAGTGEKSRAGDGKPAAEASLMGPRAVCMDSLGNTYFAEREGNGVRKVSTGGILTTIAGADSVFGYTGDGGPALAATWGAPKAMRCDLNDNVIVVDTENCAVRRIDGRTGVISTVAGTGEFGYSGDGGPGNEAMLREPNDLYLDGQGGLLIADIQDQRIRRVDLATGIITTFAGTGEKSRAGDGKPAAEASLMGPRAVCMDSLGNTYFAEREGNGVRKVSTGGILTTIAGADSVFGYTGDGGPALAATWGAPKAMRCDLNDNVIVVDTENCAVRRIDSRTGIVTTIAGGREGNDGDGGPAVDAGLSPAHGCGINAHGNLFIADTHNHRVRVVGL